MKSLRSIAFALLAAVAVAVSSAWHNTVEMVSSAVCRLRAWAFEGIDLFAKPATLDAEAVPLVERARQVAYRLRQIKRNRPVVTPRWRMCPSA